MDTSASLLESLRDASDEAAWNRLVDMYSPLLRNWLRRHNANTGDIDDVVQEVMTVVAPSGYTGQVHIRIMASDDYQTVSQRVQFSVVSAEDVDAAFASDMSFLF